MRQASKTSAYKNSKTSSEVKIIQQDGGQKQHQQKLKQNHFIKKPTDAAALYGAAPIVGAMAIDKLILDLPVYLHELDTVLDRAKQLKRHRLLVRGSTKGTFFKHAFVLKLKSGAVVRFHLVPNIPDKGAPMQMVLNPNQMEDGDSDLIIDVFKKLFPLDAKEMAAAMLIRRIDVCMRLGLPVDDLIIDLKGAMSGTKVFVMTNRQGRQQSVYVGSVESAHHGVAYDQIASDEYKRLVGEKASRTAMREDAELVLELERKTGRTQLESRRVFKKPVTLAQLAEIKTPFGGYRIMQLKMGKKKFDPAFCGYLDSVRLRGMHGTRQHWQDLCGSVTTVKDQIANWEAQLGKMAVEWWRPEHYSASLLETLQKTPAWQFLRVMK